MLKIAWNCGNCEEWNKSSVTAGEVVIVEDEYPSRFRSRCLHCGMESLIQITVKSSYVTD